MAESNPHVVDPLEWAKAHLSADEFSRLLRAMEEPLELSIRVNTLKWTADEARRMLSERYDWTLKPIPFCDSGFWITDHKTPPSAAIEHRLGYFYIQEAASMLPPELFDFRDLGIVHFDRLSERSENNFPQVLDMTASHGRAPLRHPKFTEMNPLILDMAASPGGKTTHLAALSGDCGLIVANDGSRSRIPALQVVLRNWGAVNHCVTCLPGEAFGSLYPNTFDAVLLDAPCSMQGLRAAESHTSREITESEIESLAARQTRMLESALRTVKVGGQVVYSTCTLAPQEDEMVLASLLEKFGSLIRIDDVSGKLPTSAPAIHEIDGQSLPDDMSHALRLWPHTFGTAGFFAARLTKLADLPDNRTNSWNSPPVKLLFTPAPKPLVSTIELQVLDAYEFNLHALLTMQGLALVLRDDRVILVPEILLTRKLQFPYLSAGMELGKMIREELILSHEFVSLFGDQFSQGVLTLEDDVLDAWTRGEDLRGYRNSRMAKGKVYATRDRAGRNLGRGKLLADRLKNMLPTRLF
jgi:16S rRNA (cytosine1407-C5)-methyltransferase